MRIILVIFLSLSIFPIFAQEVVEPDVGLGNVSESEIDNASGYGNIEVELSPMEWFAFGSIVLNVILVYFIFKTFQQTKENHISLNRPWISLQIVDIDGDENCKFLLKNQGRLAAEKMKISCKDRKDPKREIDVVHEINYLLPSQESEFFFNIAEIEIMQKSKSDYSVGFDIDAEITILYSFSKMDKKIVYEVVWSYTHATEEQYKSIKLLDFN